MGFSVLSFIQSQWFTKLPATDASFAGQTVIVTGSNTGLGLEAARHVVRLGAEKVIIAVRNVKAGEAAATSIAESTGRKGVCEVWALDLASYASVKAFAAKAATLPRLDCVLENAGIAPLDFAAAPDAGGHERTIAVNVISTFLLALLLLPKLRETGQKVSGSDTRLTIVASDAHAMTTFPERLNDKIFATLDDPAKYRPMERYPVSKLLEIMAVRQIAPLMGSEDTTAVRLNCCNPGLCYSELMREATFLQNIAFAIFRGLFARSTEVGGGLLVSALANGKATHGKFVSDGIVTEPDHGLVLSEDGEKTSKRVWAELSEILEGIEPGVTKNLSA